MVDDNKITREGGEELFDALAVNKTLTTLDIAKNEIPDRLIIDIKAATYRNAKAKQKEHIEGLKALDYNPALLSQITPLSQP